MSKGIDQNSLSNLSDDNRRVEQISNTIEKLQMMGAKLEQCAFDSINTTDIVLNKIKESLEILQEIMHGQHQLFDRMEFYQSMNDSEEVEAIVKMSLNQIGAMEALEEQFHEIAQAGIEANDAARSIEHVIVEQSDVVDTMLRIKEEY